MGWSSGSFATFLIVCPTSFFLGILFSLFPYDYPLLWSTIPTSESHYTLVEQHLRFLHASPPLIPRMLHIVIFLGIAGLVTKLYRPSESNMLFDGASLVLYMCGVIVYIANIVKGLRIVSAGAYGDPARVQDPSTLTPDEEAVADQILGREDSLKVLSASNTILALVLIGVLVLQAGQWYAERKEQQESEDLKKKSDAKAAAKEEKKEKERADATGNSATASGRDSPKLTRQTSSTSTTGSSKKKQ